MAQPGRRHPTVSHYSARKSEVGAAVGRKCHGLASTCDGDDMNAGRVVLALTSLVVAGLGGWLAVARWEQANHVAAVISTLATVAALGVAVWAVLRRSDRTGGLTASGTGNARAKGAGDANTGVSGLATKGIGHIVVKDTGDADTEGGDANTGIRFS